MGTPCPGEKLLKLYLKRATRSHRFRWIPSGRNRPRLPWRDAAGCSFHVRPADDVRHPMVHLTMAEVLAGSFESAFELADTLKGMSLDRCL